MKVAFINISASEVEALKTALLERGLSYNQNQVEFDEAEPYDEVAATLNVLILRYEMKVEA